jgi:cold shock CspA family protein
MRYQGKITRWNEDRGFGFITPDGSRNLVFVYNKAFAERPQRPVLNERVYYELSDDKVGRPIAENVTLISDGQKSGDSGKRLWLYALGALILLLIMVFAAGLFFLKEWQPFMQRLLSAIRF